MKKGLKVLLTLLCAVQTCWSATDSNSLLEAQFLNVNDEIKASQSTVSSEDVHEVKYIAVVFVVVVVAFVVVVRKVKLVNIVKALSLLLLLCLQLLLLWFLLSLL